MKKLLLILILVFLGAFLSWAFLPLFFDKEVNDELDPEIEALLESQDSTPPTNGGPIMEGPSGPPPTLEDEDDRAAEISTPVELPNETSSPVGEPATFVEGPFSIEDTPLHPASGNIRLIRSPAQTLVRFENYDGTNGPDLFVYLAKDLEAAEFVNLGRAKGNVGNINYTVPSDVDIDEYKYVMTWCRAFSELFDYAEIN